MGEKLPISEAVHIDDEFNVDLRPLGEKLPSYISPEIGVDMEAILSICRNSRISILRVGAFQEKEDDFAITGVSGSGEVTGTATSSPVQNRLSGESLFFHTLVEDMKGFNFTAHNIEINFAKFEADLRDSGGMLRDPELWAGFINEQLVSEFLKIVKEKHSMKLLSAYMELIYPAITIVALFSQKSNLLKLAGVIFALGLAGLLTVESLLYFPISVAIKCVVLGMKNSLSKFLAEELGTVVKYDPVTPFTLGEFEYDRILKARKLLRQGLVSTLKVEEES